MVVGRATCASINNNKSSPRILQIFSISDATASPQHEKYQGVRSAVNRSQASRRSLIQSYEAGGSQPPFIAAAPAHWPERLRLVPFCFQGLLRIISLVKFLLYLSSSVKIPPINREYNSSKVLEKGLFWRVEKGAISTAPSLLPQQVCLCAAPSSFREHTDKKERE